MIDLSSALTGGSVGTLIVAVGYVWQQFTRSRREARAEPRENTAAAVSSAEVTNSMLLASLEDARKREARLEERVETLESQNTDLHKRMFDQRREYEAEIEALREDFTRRIDALQQQLRDDARNDE